MNHDRMRWSAKREWHAQQRALSAATKIATILRLQQREVELDRVREALGKPVRGIKPWQTRP